MDFSSIIISILLMLYISNLYSDFSYIEENKDNTKNNKKIEKTTNTKTKKNIKKDVK